MATKKKEILEQDVPVIETVMSESETLPADTAQPESLPADLFQVMQQSTRQLSVNNLK